jgi:NTE family protein
MDDFPLRQHVEPAPRSAPLLRWTETLRERMATPQWVSELRAQFAALTHPTPAQPAPRSLGLVLGGGGGKAAAHLGVLQVLNDLDLPIDLMVGTSAGGAVAILYAAGLDPETIREIFRSSALRRLALPDPTRTGIFGQRRREELLTRYLGDRTFADLAIPCAVVATDLVSGTAVTINEGPLVPALLATTALPSIFPPVPFADMLLVDGGVTNNLPVDVARALGAAKVIAVELSDAVPGFALQPTEAENPLARLALAPQQFIIAQRALGLLVARTTELHLQQFPPDLLLRPEVASIPTLDLANPEKGEEAGLCAARDAAGELADLRLWRKAWQPEPGGKQQTPNEPSGAFRPANPLKGALGTVDA